MSICQIIIKTNQMIAALLDKKWTFDSLFGRRVEE